VCQNPEIGVSGNTSCVGNNKRISSYYNIIDIRKISSVGSGLDCAEARKPGRKGLSLEEADSYLSGVESLLADPTTSAAIKFECGALAKIADDENLPQQLRQRAADLRTVASDAA
jgi:hypothetical protein